MTPESSKYEAMRLDPANWRLGMVYVCADDPRLIVRQRLPVGWAWNFGHPRVWPGIALAVLVFLAPPAVAWWLGLRSIPALLLCAGLGLAAVVAAAALLSWDPARLRDSRL